MSNHNDRPSFFLQNRTLITILDQIEHLWQKGFYHYNVNIIFDKDENYKRFRDRKQIFLRLVTFSGHVLLVLSKDRV